MKKNMQQNSKQINFSDRNYSYLIYYNNSFNNEINFFTFVGIWTASA